MSQSRFIVFGKVGSGKSTLCNMLYSGHPSPRGGFQASDSVRGVTTAVDVRVSDEWIATDTIGMGEAEDGTVPTEDAKERLKKFLKATRNEYLYIIFVAQGGRFSGETLIYWETFKEIFKGGESNFVVVFTHATKKWIQTNSETLRQAYKGHNKFIAVNFWPVAEDEDDLPDEDARRRLREVSLTQLKDSLRGYCFRPVTPDICRMTDASLDRHADSIMQKIKAAIRVVYSSLTGPSIIGMLWSILLPLL